MTTRRSAFASLTGLEKRPQLIAEMNEAESNAMSKIRFIRNEIYTRSRSEDEARLQLKHARRVYVCERRNSRRCSADAAYELAERVRRHARITVNSNAAPQHVRVIENVEALKPDQ